jgi:RNA polymerase sigma-70 factor (ECF subfamily)
MDHTRSTLLMRVRDPDDSRVWGEFVALYEPLLSAYLRHRGLGPEDTRDVVQDVFARLVKSLPEFELERQRGRFRSWLWQVCRSALVDWARRRRRQSRAEDAWLRQLSESPSESQGDSDSHWGTLHRRRVLAFAVE